MGGRGTLKDLITGVRVSQSVSAHLGCGGFRLSEGGAMVIVMGMSSEPGEGRVASQIFSNGRRRGLAKARSMTKGRACQPRGTLCIPLER